MNYIWATVKWSFKFLMYTPFKFEVIRKHSSIFVGNI